MSDGPEYIGFIGYTGRSVESGYLDARKSALALLGIDEAVRYFVGVQSSRLQGAEYDLPVRVRKGSWEALIPHDLPSSMWPVLAAGAAAYGIAAAQKMAENDFEDIGVRQIFRKAIEAIQWAIRMAKHLGSMTRRTHGTVQWRNNNTEIGIPNEAGDFLFVPYEYFQMCERMPSGLLVRIATVVAEERTLEVAVYSDEGDRIESVGFADRSIFCPQDDDLLFPELVHGMNFDDEGLVTRGNESTNSLGFQYKGHILHCYPSDGSIVRFKSSLFLPSRMVGTVTREDKFGEPTEKRPKIVFDSVTPIPGAESAEPAVQPELFDADDSD